MGSQAQSRPASQSHSKMPPKKKVDPKKAGKTDSKKSMKDFLAKSKGGAAAKKKKWSKGKVREKLNNSVVFDQATYDRMMRRLPTSSWSLPLSSPSVSRSLDPLHAGQSLSCSTPAASNLRLRSTQLS